MRAELFGFKTEDDQQAFVSACLKKWNGVEALTSTDLTAEEPYLVAVRMPDLTPVSRRYEELSTGCRETINGLINAVASEQSRPTLKVIAEWLDREHGIEEDN